MFSSRSLLFSIVLSYVIVQECRGDEIKGLRPPIICTEIICPHYDVVHTEKEFEIRSYSKALWVTNPAVKEDSIMVGLGYSVQNLTDYYYKGNDQKVNIVKSGAFLMIDIFKNSTYKAYFYVPGKYQNGGLPKPLRADIVQVKLPTYKYAAVRRVSRDLVDEEVPAEVDALKKNLQRTPPYQRAANRDQFSYVLYNYDGIHFTGYEILIWFD